MGNKRVNVKAILADADLRRKLMVSTIQATQAREGIDTTPEQADRAYYVVNEGEKSVFFDLSRFKASKRDGADRREEMFIRSLRGEDAGVRHDVARRDFGAIHGHPLAYRSVGLAAHIFREAPALEPAWGIARQGLATSEDSRWLREFWEVLPANIGPSATWVRFAKGGEFSRFYYDHHLIIKWANGGRELKDFIIAKDGSESKRVYSQEHYFKPGLTWPRAATVFNVRILPAGHIFADKGPVILPAKEGETWFIAGVLNSDVILYLSKMLTSREEMGGRWEVGSVKRLPIPRAAAAQHESVGKIAQAIYNVKADWDAGNETSNRFSVPWLLNSPIAGGLDTETISVLLDRLTEVESAVRSRIQQFYAELNEEVYLLYGIPDATRKTMDETLGDRPDEVPWPQMEGKTAAQKRMEHLWRLLSYAVKRVLEADDNGIICFSAVNGEPRLVERVRHELASLFPGRDANEVEVEITNELKKTVKGYRKCASIDEWLDNAFFEYHCGLYKNRPIFWHIASAQGNARFAFGALVHYHRFDKNRMATLRATHLRDAIEEFRREAGLADKAGRSDDRLEFQAKVEEAQALDRKLQFIQEGHHEGVEGGERDYRILTPWKAPSKRPKGWDPDLDDGVKVNIEPFEKAGVLRVVKVT